MELSLTKHLDGKIRCSWCGDDSLYMHYHDTEWGVPLRDDDKLFEKICLEGFQAGLSWITILRKREAFRAGFAGFKIDAVSAFKDADVERLVNDAGIVRHRGKIASAINNANRARALIDAEGSLSDFVWQFKPADSSRPKRMTPKALAKLTSSPESEALSKALKSYGFTFVGATTMYAFMQSVGIVNDHLDGCSFR